MEDSHKDTKDPSIVKVGYKKDVYAKINNKHIFTRYASRKHVKSLKNCDVRQFFRALIDLYISKIFWIFMIFRDFQIFYRNL